MTTTHTTYHVLRNTKYSGGGWYIAGDEVDGWLPIKTDGAAWFARPCDLFETEEQARTEARARRQPRRARTPRPLYGDFAQLAAISGIRTDGSGRLARR